MVINCPSCQARYRIDPQGAPKPVARVKCPACQHIYEIRLSEDPLVGEPVASSGESAGADTRPKVLVVDDARLFREMIKDLLKTLPVDILTAANGDEAWQIISTEPPQLVMLDLNIPGRSGKELLKSLRSDPRFDGIRVVVMSGVERGETTATEMRRQGADDFISKSFKPHELENRVRQLLGL